MAHGLLLASDSIMPVAKTLLPPGAATRNFSRFSCAFLTLQMHGDVRNHSVGSLSFEEDQRNIPVLKCDTWWRVGSWAINDDIFEHTSCPNFAPAGGRDLKFFKHVTIYQLLKERNKV